MKTSNKLIAIGYGFFILCFASFFIAAKSNMVEQESVAGSGVIESRNFGSMTAETIEIDGHFTCELDPHSSDVIVTGDDNIISMMGNPINDNKLMTWGIYGDSYNISTTVQPKLIIGIKDLNSLIIKLDNYSTLNALDTLLLDKLRINTSGNSKIELTLQCDRLSLTTTNYSKQILKGSANLVILNSSNNSRLSAESFKVNEWDINLANYAKASVTALESIEGNMSNSSKIVLHGNPRLNSITTMNSAEINLINSK